MSTSPETNQESSGEVDEEELMRANLALFAVLNRVQAKGCQKAGDVVFSAFRLALEENNALGGLKSDSNLKKAIVKHISSVMKENYGESPLLSLVKAASSWCRIASEDSPMGAAVRFAAASEVLSKESGPMAAAAESIGLLERELRKGWSSFLEGHACFSEDGDKLAETYADEPPTENDAFSWDMAFSWFLKKTGVDGQKKAKDIRAKSRNRLARFKAQEVEALELFPLWLPKDASPAFPALVILGQALWRDIVLPRLERAAEEQRKYEAPIRFPQPVGQAVAIMRNATVGSLKKKAMACGEDWAEHVMVDSPGMQLFLEYDGQGPGSTLQSILTGGLLRTYLLTHAACADQAGMSPVDGTFAWEERAVFQRYVAPGKKAGGHQINLMREDMAQLLKMRVVALEGIKMAQPEPLVNLYTEEKTGRMIYTHANVVLTFLRERFSQIPRAVLRLDSRDIPLALGLATLARSNAVKILAGNNTQEMSLAQLAAVCGEDTRAGARKSGTAYWSNILDRLSRIARTGDIGELVNVDVGADRVASESRVRFSLHERLATSYAPLVKTHDARRRLAARGKG